MTSTVHTRTKVYDLPFFTMCLITNYCTKILHYSLHIKSLHDATNYSFDYTLFHKFCIVQMPLPSHLQATPAPCAAAYLINGDANILSLMVTKGRFCMTILIVADISMMFILFIYFGRSNSVSRLILPPIKDTPDQSNESCPFQSLRLLSKDQPELPPLPNVSNHLLRIRIETSWGAPIVWADTEANVLARQPKGVYNVGLNIVAIAKYTKFLQPLITSADKYFMRDHNVTYFIISDKLDEVAKVKTNRHIVSIMEKNQGWPNNTLVRFQFISKHRDIYHDMDFMFQVDADMLFVSSFNSEALGSRVGTLHPGFYNKPRSQFTYDRNPKSTAYVKPSEGEYYFAGGVLGGCQSEVITMADTIVRNILTDLHKYNYIALWHDESHVNRYFIDHPPTKILSPEYCMPEGTGGSMKQRLLALNKNHKAIRS